jgi:hypothetical protein
MATKTHDLIVSVWHQDGRKMGHRAVFNSKENRDEAGHAVLMQAADQKTITVGPDALGAALVLNWDDVQAVHLRTEDPPKPPETVELNGKRFVPVKSSDGCDVLYPAAWFELPESKPAAASVN